MNWPLIRSAFRSGKGERYKAAGGEIVDLTEDIQPNYDYFKTGPGYKALQK